MSGAIDDGRAGPGSSQPDRRTVAVAGHIGAHDTAWEGLRHLDPAVRATALGALERLGVLDDEALVRSFGDADADVRRRAAAVAARHRDIDLCPLLDDVAPAVVEMAAWACGEHEAVPARVLERLVALAGGAGVGDDDLVREAAVAALGAIGVDAGLDAILSATGDRPAIRRRAVLALAPFLDPEHPRAPAVAAALARGRDDRDWQVRQAAEDLTAVDEVTDDDRPAQQR